LTCARVAPPGQVAAENETVADSDSSLAALVSK
jgi:hypothetical protein